MTYKRATAAGAQVRGEKVRMSNTGNSLRNVSSLSDDGSIVLDKDDKPVKETTVQLERPKVFIASVFNGAD